MSSVHKYQASECYPGDFPDCGCHYTIYDDGVHFCPLHHAAADLLKACRAAQQALRGGVSKDKDYSYELGLLRDAINKAHTPHRRKN